MRNLIHNPFLGIEAALFDLDGTLIKTHIDFDQMRREMLARNMEIGAPPPINLDILSIVRHSADYLAQTVSPEEGEEFTQRAFARLEEIETEQCSQPEHLTGASELLYSLRTRNIPVGVVTRNCRTVAQWLLESGDLPCDVLLTRDDVPHVKPDPDHLFRALSALNCDNPATTVMTGDHYMDVQAGRAAGMRTVGILHGREASAFEECVPDCTVENAVVLLEMLEAAG